MSLKNERESVLFQTDGEVAAPVSVTLTEEGSLRTRGGRARRSSGERARRRAAGPCCGAGRRRARPPAAEAPGAVALQGAGGRRTRAGERRDHGGPSQGKPGVDEAKSTGESGTSEWTACGKYERTAIPLVCSLGLGLSFVPPGLFRCGSYREYVCVWICVLTHNIRRRVWCVLLTQASHCCIPCALDLIGDMLPFCFSYRLNSLFQWASTPQSVSFTCHGEIRKSIVNYYGFNSQLSCLCQMCHCVCLTINN